MIPQSYEDLEIEQYHHCNKSLQWRGLYNQDSKYKRFRNPDSNAHPAKMPPALANQILKHLEELNLLKKDSRIIDFMAGTATTGLAAELNGYEFIGIELEDHFIDMIEKNREVLKSKINRDPNWTILKGDARKLSELIGAGAAITSPPYSNIEIGKGLNTKPPRPGHDDQSGRSAESPSQQVTNYSALISPPHGSIQVAKNNSSIDITERQIGNLPDKAGIVSPPYEDQLPANANFKPPHDSSGNFTGQIYGNSENQIGNQTNETYLSAMLQVYKEAFKSGISPLVTVTKNPTRNGELRRLDIDTALLLQMARYKVIDYHQSILWTEHTQQTLFGNEIKQVKGRMSFFKRLSYQKGNVVAQWEDVIIAVRDER